MNQDRRILNAILSKDIFDYVLVDKAFRITAASQGVERYLSSQPKVGDDAFVYLPELVGNEEEVLQVFSRKYSLFTLESVEKNNYYVNLSVEYFDEKQAMILFHNITVMTLARQGIMQKSNEATLLHTMLQKIIDSLSSLLFVVDRKGEIAFANQRYREYFGGDKNVHLYRYIGRGLDDYDALCTYLGDKEVPVEMGDDTFMVQAIQIESMYQLFTLSRVTTIVRENFHLSQELQYDSLTGVYRKKFFDERLEQLLKNGEPFVLVVVDIDNFKSINDTYGHTLGDEILREFTYVIKGCLRKNDLIARWGGEEFVFALRTNEIDDAMTRMEALRKKIARHTFPKVNHLTASIGISWNTHCPCETAESILRRADTAMYVAKNEGKNRVQLAPKETCREMCS